VCVCVLGPLKSVYLGHAQLLVAQSRDRVSQV